VKVAPVQFGNVPIADVTKERPFVNSLGMKFVPVPGTDVLFCIWETRVKDYAAYAQGKKVDGGWKTAEKNGVPVGREPDHPVILVSWEDANAFCQWLTKKEATDGKLPGGTKYRLPTDDEWSRAVGLPKEAGSTPKERNGKVAGFPWGEEWPPKDKAGNYPDSAFHEKFPKSRWLNGYTDGFATTAPVGSFPPNQFGIYDLGGNAWEWCEDPDEPGSTRRLMRGSSWSDSLGVDRDHLLASIRNSTTPAYRGHTTGFRCVLAASAR